MATKKKRGARKRTRREIERTDTVLALERLMNRRTEVSPVIYPMRKPRDKRAPASPGLELLTARPRQRRLVPEEQRRRATVRALEVAVGKPIGRVTRQKLKGRVPEALRDTLCVRKRERREVMFAVEKAGKGKTKAARRPREHKVGKC